MSVINSQQRQNSAPHACLDDEDNDNDDGQSELPMPIPTNNVGQPRLQHHFDEDDPRSIRKYLVLLHDCLAIKFVPFAVSSTTTTAAANHRYSHSPSFPFNNNDTINNAGRSSSRNSNCYATIDSVLNGKSGGSRNSYCNQRHSNYNNGSVVEDHQLASHNASKSNSLSSAARIIGPTLMTGTVNMINGAGTATGSSLLTESSSAPIKSGEVDHSHHGLHLYKAFREENLKCYWNATLYEAFQNLEYKGYVVPSTLLIRAIPRHLATLRTAWSRRILRSPPGFHIEFMGEIEELLADPIRQSQFAPLSDSLCWAILEITSMGQEAFVDSISTALAAAFPTMVLPAKELIYATLEKLIKERKVYQTSHGYFVVTPDTFRYMVSADNSQQQPQPLYVKLNQPGSNNNNGMMMPPLDALVGPQPQVHRGSEQMNSSRNSWVSGVNEKNSSSVNNDGDGNSIIVIAERERDPRHPHQLRRHNSMKIVRQRDASDATMTAPSFMRDKTRSMSFRLYKSKSIPNSLKEDKKRMATMKKVEKLNKQMENLLKKDSVKNSKTKNEVSQEKSGKSSFFRKLFKRSTSKKADKPAPGGGSPKSSASTQTPPSNAENSNSDSTPSTPPIIPVINATLPKHFTLRDDFLRAGDDDIKPSPAAFNARCNSLPRRPTSRLSILNDEPHLYSSPTHPYETNNNNKETILNAAQHARRFHIGGSSRSSTLSQGTSLGYGSQGPMSLGCVSSQSPSPSMSPSGIYSTLNHNSANKDHAGSSPPHVPQSLTSTSNNGASHNLLPSRSSRSYGSYRNYYDYYRRRYPPYGSTTTTMQNQPTSFSSTILGTAAGNTNTLSSRSSQAIAKPAAHTHQKDVTAKITQDTHNNNENGTISTTTSTTTKNSPYRTTTTTTVTQNVKSTTNMELEFSLPLGKSSSFLTSQKVQSPSVKTALGSSSDKVNVNMFCAQPHTRITIGQLQPKNNETTEVKTTINHDGSIETHFNCSGDDPNALVCGKELSAPNAGTDDHQIEIKLNGSFLSASELKPVVALASNEECDSPIKKADSIAQLSQPLQQNGEKVVDNYKYRVANSQPTVNAASLRQDVFGIVKPKGPELRCYNNGIVNVSDFAKSVETDFM